MNYKKKMIIYFMDLEVFNLTYIKIQDTAQNITIPSIYFRIFEIILFLNLPSHCPHNCQTICVNYVVGVVVIMFLRNLGVRDESHSYRHMVKFAKVHTILAPLDLTTADVK